MALIYQKAQREDQRGANSEHKQSGFPALGQVYIRWYWKTGTWSNNKDGCHNTEKPVLNFKYKMAALHIICKLPRWLRPTSKWLGPYLLLAVLWKCSKIEVCRRPSCFWFCQLELVFASNTVICVLFKISLVKFINLSAKN